MQEDISLPSFQDKVVVITGASQGIGKATAEAFALQGAKVVLVARKIAPLEELEDSLLSKGADVMAVPADISDPLAIHNLVNEVQQMYGAADILVNNAAVAVLKPMVEMTPDEWQLMMSVNLQGMIALTHEFLHEMIHRRSGVIINMSAAIAHSGFPNLAVYSATKAATIAFSQALAKEVRRYGVLVYSICPHGVNTTLYQRLFGAAEPDTLIAPERVAQEILTVAAGKSSIRSGQTLDINL